MLTIYRTLLLASFAMWFGGFGFYVSIVVPVGTDVLGSSLNQGMITRQVTQWINIFAGIAVAMMLLESFLSWKELPAMLRTVSTRTLRVDHVGAVRIGLPSPNSGFDAGCGGSRSHRPGTFLPTAPRVFVGEHSSMARGLDLVTRVDDRLSQDGREHLNLSGLTLAES